MIIQGSNIPLTVVFDKPVSGMDLVVSLWSVDDQRAEAPIKKWTTADMTVAGDTAVCPLTEAETAGFPARSLMVEAKGLSGGETVFWSAVRVDVLGRRDRVIRLTEV